MKKEFLALSVAILGVAQSQTHLPSQGGERAQIPAKAVTQSTRVELKMPTAFIEGEDYGLVADGTSVLVLGKNLLHAFDLKTGKEKSSTEFSYYISRGDKRLLAADGSSAAITLPNTKRAAFALTSLSNPGSILLADFILPPECDSGAGRFSGLALGPGGKQIAIRCDLKTEAGNKLFIVDTDSGKLVREFKFPTYITSAAFSRDGKEIAIGSGLSVGAEASADAPVGSKVRQKITIGEIATGKQKDFYGHGMPRALSYMSDGKRLALWSTITDAKGSADVSRILNLETGDHTKADFPDVQGSKDAFLVEGDKLLVSDGRKISVYGPTGKLEHEAEIVDK